MIDKINGAWPRMAIAAGLLTLKRCTRPARICERVRMSATCSVRSCMSPWPYVETGGLGRASIQGFQSPLFDSKDCGRAEFQFG